MAAEDTDWLYNDDIDVPLSADRERLDSVDSRVLDAEDLLDDVLTAPAAAPPKTHRNSTDATEEELLGVRDEDRPTGMEESGSARFNAEQMAKTVQARIEANRTSQSIQTRGGPNIYAREPNRKNSVFVGNLTWWTTDQDLILAMREAGLKEVVNIKFFENRTNGQSKGYALVELANEILAINAGSKLQELTIHNQKPLVSYAAKISPHQFELKCSTGKADDSLSLPPSKPQVPKPSFSHPSFSQPQSSFSQSSFSQPSFSQPSFSQPLLAASLPSAAPPAVRPPVHMPGLPPPPFPGFRPPLTGLTDSMSGILPFPPPMPPFPPAGLSNHLAAATARAGALPTLPPPLPPGLAGLIDPSKGIAPHLNPAFLQDTHHGGNMMELFARAAQQFKSQAAAFHGMSAKKEPTEEEASDANQRNRAISSSAINRALADARDGDFENAMDTLRMAITLIKQSVTAGNESTQIMIQSLQDCLSSIDQQSSSNKRSHGRDHRHDDRERERGRSSGGHSSGRKHHRDRSRERRR